MKKIFATVLTLALVLAMGTTAFAVELDAATTSTSKEIMVTFADDASSLAVISVDVTFGDLTFKYAGASDNAWDPETHTYSASTTTGTWQAVGDNTVTLTNHSNRDVKAAFTIDETYADFTDNNITISFSHNMTEFTLWTGDVCEDGTIDTEAVWITSTITVSGDPTEGASIPQDAASIGTLWVTITPLNTQDGTEVSN